MQLIRFLGDGEDNEILDGLHLDGADGADYTLCGITLDGDSKTAGGFELIDAPKVTCPTCVGIIKHCRGVRI